MLDLTEATRGLGRRVDELDWADLSAQLDANGYVITPALLSERECGELAELFDHDEHFRSTIEMARYRFGDGRYRYFDHPLPDAITTLRGSFYPHLARIANRWAGLLRGSNRTFPLDHERLLAQCRAAGHRAAPARAEPCPRPDPRAWSFRRLPDRGATESGGEPISPGGNAPWGVHRDRGTANGLGNHLPRRRVDQRRCALAAQHPHGLRIATGVDHGLSSKRRRVGWLQR